MSFPIRYRTITYSGYGNPADEVVDTTGWVRADLVKPALKVADALFPDRNGTTVPYSVNASSSAAAAKTGAGASKAGSTEAKAAVATSTQALILHLHGKSGQRAQVLTVR